MERLERIVKFGSESKSVDIFDHLRHVTVRLRSVAFGVDKREKRLEHTRGSARRRHHLHGFTAVGYIFFPTLHRLLHRFVVEHNDTVARCRSPLQSEIGEAGHKLIELSLHRLNRNPFFLQLVNV